MNPQNQMGIQQSEVMNSMVNKNMNERMSIQHIGFSPSMMPHGNFDSTINNNYMSHNPQMYMSARGPMNPQMSNRMLNNTFGANELNKIDNNRTGSQNDSNELPRNKSKKKSPNKKNPFNKSKSRNFKSIK